MLRNVVSSLVAAGPASLRQLPACAAAWIPAVSSPTSSLPTMQTVTAAARACMGAAPTAWTGVGGHQPGPRHQYLQARSLHLAPPFLVEGYTPSAVTLHRLGGGRLEAKVQAALKELESCKACPRDCGVNRLKDELGQCSVGRKAVVSSVNPHFGEEAVLQGWNGSGTVFFGLCNLKCVFCQNHDISNRQHGYHLDADEIADWMLKLQDLGSCHNINLVTPEHVVPQVVEAIAKAVSKGLSLPIVYNTSSYDSLASLKMIDGLVDIYLPDFKFWTPESSQRYAKARDYPEVARAAIQEMHRQVGDLVFSPDGLAQRGLLLRHLAMPELVQEGKDILSWVAQEVSTDTYVHIMEQYRPQHLVGVGEQRSRGFTKYEEIDRPVSNEEVDELRAHARRVGLWRFEEAPRWG